MRAIRLVGLMMALALSGQAATNRTPILRGVLQSNLDLNGQDLTNGGTFHGTVVGPVGLSNLVAGQSLPPMNAAALTNLPVASEKLKRYDVTTFGATGSGRVVTRCNMTSGSKNLTTANGTFSEADVGKVISVYGGGSANQNLTSIITNVTTATSITLSNAAAANVVNMSAVYGPDDTVGIQAALDFVAPLGGDIFFPEGIYIVAGPLRDTGAIATHHNAQLYLPDVTPVAGQVGLTLTLAGPMPANSRGQGTFLGTDINTAGAVIWSTLVRGPDVNPGRMLDCRNFTTHTSGSPACNGEHFDILLNNINVNVRDLTFYGAFDNNIALVDLRGAPNAAVTRNFFAAGYPEAQAPEPTGTNGYAVQMPSSFTQNLNVFSENVIIGFYNGLEVSASVYGSINWITTCYNGVFLEAGGIPSRFDFLELYQTKNAFRGGQCEANAHIWAVLHNNVQNWWSVSQKTVNDPGNAVTGFIKVHVNNTYTNSLAPVGAANLEFEIIGNLFNGVYQPALRRAPLTAQTGGPTSLGQYTLGLGADTSALTVTPNTQKSFSVAFPRFQDTNFNACSILSGFAFNADLTILDLGSDGGQFSKKGANRIRIFTAADGNSAPTLQWIWDTAGNLVPQQNAVSIGISGASVPTFYVTNVVFGATNTAPADIATVRSWLTVTARGQTFKMPLYQ